MCSANCRSHVELQFQELKYYQKGTCLIQSHFPLQAKIIRIVTKMWSLVLLKNWFRWKNLWSNLFWWNIPGLLSCFSKADSFWRPSPKHHRKVFWILLNILINLLYFTRDEKKNLKARKNLLSKLTSCLSSVYTPLWCVFIYIYIYTHLFLLILLSVWILVIEAGKSMRPLQISPIFLSQVWKENQEAHNWDI